MDLDFSLELYLHAIDKTTENALWEDWKLQYPNMTEDTYISFLEYKKKHMERKTSTDISFDEIEIEMAKVEKAFKERR